MPAIRSRYPFLAERHRVLALFGPTAAGKSALAHAAALALGGEIIVADPFQRYRGLEIASDAPTRREQAEVAYHFVGDLDLTQSSTAGDYSAAAHAVIDDILGRGRIPIVAGGTGLYLRAALADLEFPAEVPAKLRQEVESLVADDPHAAIAELTQRDPAVAARIDLNNPRRISRALELARAGGTRPTHDRLWTDATRHVTRLLGVTRPRDVLDALILERVHRELSDGLVAELEAAIETPGFSRTAAQIIGVREVLAMRAGGIEAGALPQLLAARTRKLARAQLTWLRKTPSLVELDVGTRSPEQSLPDLLAAWHG